MAAVCQSVQIEMYVCNLSKNFSLSMILVMSDTLYGRRSLSVAAADNRQRTPSNAEQGMTGVCEVGSL